MQSYYGGEKIVLQRNESALQTKTVKRDRRQEPDMENIRTWIFSLRITRKKEVERLVPDILQRQEKMPEKAKASV